MKLHKLGWSEPAATNAPVQDEAVQAVLGMNQKHKNTSSSPAQGFFSPLPCPKIFLSYLPPTSLLPITPHPTCPPHSYLPTSLPSFPAHSIFRASESSGAWVAQSFEETKDIRLDEGGELNVEGTWRGEGKRSSSSQM